jgi:amino acid adenylation domain-containing protein
VAKTAPETYSRPITGEEWWRFGALRGLGPLNQLLVEGDGVIDEGELATAVAVASRACPGARLVRRGRQWVDSGQPPAVRAVDAAGFDRARLDSPLLRTPLTCQKSSSEVVLVPGTPTTIIFRAHSAVTDGHGLMLWQRQVFRALRGEPVEEATSRLTRDEVLAEIAATLGPRQEAAQDPDPEPRPAWLSVLGELPSGSPRSLWRRRTIDGIHVGVTAKIARLVTAYGDGDRRGVVGIPVDLRQYLPGLRTTASVGGLIDIYVRADDDWSDVDASMLTALSERRFLANQDNSSVLTMPTRLMLELNRWTDNLARQDHNVIRERNLAAYVAGVAHLGAVDLADFCTDGFEATSYYSLGSVNYTPGFDVVESRGRTELTLAWRDGPGVAERAEALLDWIEEGLSPRAHRVWDGNRTDRAAPPATLTHLFAEQVDRTPGAVAIRGAEGDLTYAELSRRADAVAAALRARGIGRGDRVGLVAGRSSAAIAAIWGILKAGAAYLPVDDSYPDTRVARLLTDARAPVCLLEPPNQQRGFLPAGCQGISLDTLPQAPPQDPAHGGPEPDDLACVIYTSGSTGAPKGVEIEHRSLVNYVRWATREAGIDATTKMPLIASISFDMAGCAIYLPLLAGGTVLPVREVNASTLREVLEQGGATAMAITPSHLDLINQVGIRRSAMRVVMTAGELLRRSTAVRAREIFGPECRILCQWGPTETTIVNTSHEFDPERDTGAGVPFGRPLDNNTVHLLDPRGRFVPPGEPGEAYVGGVQVARGYLGRPDLTRQRFVRLADGSRVYRTGDIARLLPGGELAFIGRIDDQVKVSGHRIEPAEVAQALEEHPGVRQAVVIARSRPGRESKELCAYVVGDPAGLTEFLAERLPRYMLPAAITAVPGIPRTANGKTDAARLPDPFTSTVPGDGPAAGRDRVTDAIAGIWARALRVDAHLIDDQTDFRALGGDSILMLSMIDEVSRTVAGAAQAEFMAEFRQILREPTLARVSDIARSAMRRPVRPTRARDTSSRSRRAAGPPGLR